MDPLVPRAGRFMLNRHILLIEYSLFQSVLPAAPKWPCSTVSVRRLSARGTYTSKTVIFTRRQSSGELSPSIFVSQSTIGFYFLTF